MCDFDFADKIDQRQSADVDDDMAFLIHTLAPLAPAIIRNKRVNYGRFFSGWRTKHTHTHTLSHAYSIFRLLEMIHNEM